MTAPRGEEPRGLDFLKNLHLFYLFFSVFFKIFISILWFAMFWFSMEALPGAGAQPGR